MIGNTIGRYHVTEKLGEGGMGEVYRARDPRIGRDVALKLLPAVFAGDPERIVRFEREAQVLGSLNHQNIAAIYGVEPASDSESAPPVLVMELVEGPTLAERINAGALPIDEALAIAAQIAEALDAAHELGIIHRDLKPANVKLRPDSTVKVLDFGLAKITEPPAASHISASAATFSPTISLGATSAGVIIGTAAYMAPEQARGRVVDKRADVWAFGVVLYEMLTGQRAFKGEDVSDTLASVIKFDPDWGMLPADTPAAIRRLLKRCLAKDPKQRLRECGSALLDIREAQSGDAVEAMPVATRQHRSWLPVLAAGAVAAAVTAGALALRPKPTPTPMPLTRFTITLPEDLIMPEGNGTLLSIAPDGRTILYRANRGGERRLYRRALDQFEATVIGSVEPTSGNTITSPDGHWIVVDENRTLKKIHSDSGAVQTLTSLNDQVRGLTWTPDGNLLVGLNGIGRGVLLVPMSGGTATEFFKAPEGRRTTYPQVLRNGAAVLFTVAAPGASSGEVHLLVEQSDRKLLEQAAAGRVLPTDHLVFVRAGALWAVPFDPDRLEVRGTPAPVVEGIRVEGGGAVQYDVSNNGTLAFIPGTLTDEAQRPLQFASLDGKVTPLPAALRAFSGAVLSPDGTRLAVQIDVSDSADIWVVDIARGALTRLTANTELDNSPVWSPDGQSVAFSSRSSNGWTLQRKAADGTGSSAQLATLKPSTGGAVFPFAWTADGHIVTTYDGDIGLVAADGKGEWKPLIKTAASEGQPAISPDGRWIAYMSNETGAAEVYVQAFPGLAARQLVSVGGGLSPTWSRDGRSLLYLRGGPPQDIMRVAIEATRESGLRISAPVKVGDWTFYATQFLPRFYDVTADGRLIVIGRPTNGDTSARQINVITNWFEELKRLVPIQ